jgi:hypothetical protein
VVMDFKDEAGLWWSRTNGARASEPAFEHAVRAWCPLRRITLAGVTDKESADPDAVANGPRVTVEDLRRFADSIRDLDDPAVMARAWD